MKTLLAGLLLVCLGVLYGCGGGGGSGGGSSSPSTVSGTASQGLALAAGTTVTLVDAKGATKTTTVGANGAYSIVVDGLTAPFVLNAGGFYSYASGSGTTNINPFTNLSMQAALGTSSITANTVIPVNYQTTFTTVVNSLKTDLSTLYPSDVPLTQADFLNGNIAIGSGVDKVFASTTITPPDSSGNFSITVSGQTIITGKTSSGNVTLTPNNSAISTASGNLFPDITVSGQVTLNGAGLSGASVTLTGTGSSTVQTNSNGDFIFTYVQNGSYTLSAAMAGYTMSASHTITVSGSSVLGVAFTATAGSVSTYAITGMVTQNGLGFSGVTVNLSGGGSSTATTASNGNYSFTGLSNGSYTVSASYSGYTLSANQTVTVNSANVTGINFTATPTSSGAWTWVSGSNSASVIGTYGTKGTATSANVPGARSSAASWIDSSGNLWLFGGTGYDSSGYRLLNDLWKYSPKSGEWTWVSGSSVGGAQGTYGTMGTAASANVPGARGSAASWIDSSGNLWLFGGYGCDGNNSCDNNLNDLWKFSPTSGMWAWVNGSSVGDAQGTYGTMGTAASSNVPEARQGAVSWIDSSGNLWLFGGSYFIAGTEPLTFNDLWKYSPTSGKWTWVSGSNVVDSRGTYGTMGTAANSNVPSSRDSAVSWIDSSGNLWLFGGRIYPCSTQGDSLNDLWKYSPTSGEWTWVSGSSGVNSNGTYGTMGTAASSNVPGARSSAASWIDSSGNLWLFGGYGMDGNGSIDDIYLNDLWKYSPTSGEWTWGGGSRVGDGQGTYGTKGTAASANVPSSRDSAVSWIDSSGNLWLFGGYNYGNYNNINNHSSEFNDLWNYKP